MSDIEKRARQIFAEWHKVQGCGDRIVEDCNNGLIQMPDLAFQLVCMALIPPDGYVLVPIEPSREMVKAGNEAADECKFTDEIYWAMLDARPEVS